MIIIKINYFNNILLNDNIKIYISNILKLN